MTLYAMEYRVFDGMRDDVLTFFASMDEAADKKEMGPNVELLGRWHNMGEGSGFCVARAKSVADINSWILNWVTMCNIMVTPICDDNTARAIILKKEPDWKCDYSGCYADPKEGESLYFFKFKFYADKKMAGYTAFSGMTEAQDKGDAGACTNYGRWHNLGNGSGYGIASAPSEAALYKWCFNWASMCEIQITPVTKDKTQRDVIKNKPGYEGKLKALMAKMGMK